MNNHIEKVLLILPPVFTSTKILDVNPLPPLGLAYIAAILEQRGIEVRIFDALAEGWHERVQVAEHKFRIGSSFEEVERIIREFQPDLVGVNNLFTTQRQNAHEIYRITKAVNSAIVTVAGGAHPTVMPELVLEDKNVDFVVLGEGEKTFDDLLDVLAGKKQVETLDGIGFRKDGEVRLVPKTKFIENLDELPFPARHLLNMEKYFGLEASHGVRHRRRFSPIVTSRGCPARCTFCSAHRVWGHGFRARSPENVVAEMKQMKEQFGIEEILFEDDNFTLDPCRAEKIFDLMVEQKLDFVWDTPNGIAAWTLTEKVIDKMKASGCCLLNFPIESGNQYVLKNIIRKPVNLDKIEPLVQHARKIGLPAGMFFVIGMPGETEEQIWDTFRFARKMGIYNPHISVATPYPGTELFDVCVEKGYLKPGFSLDDLFIRAFPISTEKISRERLKKIFVAGKYYLFWVYIQDRPLEVLQKFFVKLFTSPRSISKRLCQLFLN
ncbi:MAG: cobalamin-dependent protein [Candidatus Omnitrophica bacterium]|nr:cobalamin-dependent protein [Candidatus Omnitrophota bacterium]